METRRITVLVVLVFCLVFGLIPSVSALTTDTTVEPITVFINPTPAIVEVPGIVVSGTTNADKLEDFYDRNIVIVGGKFSFYAPIPFANMVFPISIIAYKKGAQTRAWEVEIFYKKTPITFKLVIGEPTLWVNGVASPIEAPPIISNSRTLVPIRALVEAVGGIVYWDAVNQKVEILLGFPDLTLTIGNNKAYINNKAIFIDAANAKVVPVITNGHTLLPLRFVAESLGFKVSWDAITQTIGLVYGS